MTDTGEILANTNPKDASSVPTLPEPILSYDFEDGEFPITDKSWNNNGVDNFTGDNGSATFESTSASTPRFKIIRTALTWEEAKADAKLRGGRLAILNSQEKIDEVKALLTEKGSWPKMWIDASDERSEGKWKAGHTD